MNFDSLLLALLPLFAAWLGAGIAHVMQDTRTRQQLQDHLNECERRYESTAASMARIEAKLDRELERPTWRPQP